MCSCKACMASWLLVMSCIMLFWYSRVWQKSRELVSNHVTSPECWVASSCLPVEWSGCSQIAFSWLVAWAPMWNHASWWDNSMKSRANFPHRVCTSWLRRNISSYCAAVSPDVARIESTCMFVSCPLLWTGWCALDGVTRPCRGHGYLCIHTSIQWKGSPDSNLETECKVNLWWGNLEP